jgi:hypothetical protein
MAKGSSSVSAQQKKAEEQQRRETQLSECQAIEAALNGERSAAIDALKRHSGLTSHAASFYTEIDKLAKKQATMPVTDMAVEAINAIIADAKALIQNDPHLDRVKQFVPAGSNPAHSDVVLQTSFVRTALQRGKESLERSAAAKASQSAKASYLADLIQFIIEDGSAQRDEIVDDWASRSEFDNWFDEDGEFDVDTLDRIGVAKFLAGDEDAAVPEPSEDDE